MSEALQGSIEDNVLTLLVWSTQHATTLASVITPDLFSTTAYQQIAKAAISYVERFKHPPQAHIRDMLESERRRDGGKFLDKIIDAMQRLQHELQPHYVMEELDKFVRIKRRLQSMDKAYEALAIGDEEQAEEALWRGNSSQANSTIGTWLQDDDMSFLGGRDEDFFSSGIDALDRAGIRPERGTQTMLIGPKKSGKSWWCINSGKAGLRFGHPVLHITLENSERLTKRRYLQSFFAMTKTQVQTVRLPHFSLDEDGQLMDIRFDEIEPMALIPENQQEIVRRIRTLRARPRLLIKNWPSGVLTVPRLDAYLDRLDREHDFRPELLIVDYPNLMQIDAKNLRVSLGRTFVGLRGIAVDRNLAQCVPTQGNRESEGANIVTSRHVAEDWSTAGTADTILALCRTAKEREKGLARILVDAARDEEDQFLVLISQSYATGQFCLSSHRMSVNVQAALERATGAAPDFDPEGDDDDADA